MQTSASFGIFIETEADLEAAKASAAVMADNIAKAKQLGLGYDAMQSKLDQVNSQIKKYSGSLNEGGRETGKLELNHRALHGIMHQIGSVTAPELGHALAGALYGQAGVALAIGFAMEFVHRKLEEAHEAAVQLEAAKFEQGTKSLQEMAAATDDLDAALNKAATDEDTIKTKAEQTNAVFAAQVEQHKKILDAMEAVEIASAGDNAEAIKQIKERYEGLKKNYDLEANYSKLLMQRREIADRTDKQPGLEKAAKDLLPQIAALQNEDWLIKARQFLANDKNKTAAGNAMLTVKEFGGEAAIKKMPAPIDDGSELPTGFQDPKYFAAQNALKILENWENLSKLTQMQEESIRTLQGGEKNAADQAAANQTAITKGQESYDTGRKVFSQNTGGDELSRAIELSRRAQAGGQLDEGDKEFLHTIGTMVAGQNVSVETAEKMFVKASQNQQILDSFLNRMMGVLDRIPNFVEYELRLKRLETKLPSLLNK